MFGVTSGFQKCIFAKYNLPFNAITHYLTRYFMHRSREKQNFLPHQERLFRQLKGEAATYGHSFNDGLLKKIAALFAHRRVTRTTGVDIVGLINRETGVPPHELNQAAKNIEATLKKA